MNDISKLEQTSDIPFGKFFIRRDKLRKNILSVYCLNNRGQKRKVNNLPNKIIDEKLADILLHDNKANYNFSRLHASDKEYISKLLLMSGGTINTNVEKDVNRYYLSFSDMQNRLQLLMGQIEAGNEDNPTIKNEISDIVNTLDNAGILSMYISKKLIKKYVMS